MKIFSFKLRIDVKKTMYYYYAYLSIYLTTFYNCISNTYKKVKTVEILSTYLCIKTSKHSKYRIFIHHYQTTYNVQSNTATTPKGITLAAASQV